MSEAKIVMSGLTPELKKLIEDAKSKRGEVCEMKELSLGELELIAGGTAPQSFNSAGVIMSRHEMYDNLKMTEEYFGHNVAMNVLRRIFSDAGYKNTDIVVYAYNTYADCDSMFSFLDSYC